MSAVVVARREDGARGYVVVNSQSRRFRLCADVCDATRFVDCERAKDVAVELLAAQGSGALLGFVLSVRDV